MDDFTGARVAIAALIAELTNLGDAGKIDALSQLFADGGTYTLHNGSAASGPSAIERMLSEFSKNMPGSGDAAPKFMRHNITTSHIEVDGDVGARGDTYFLNVNDNGLDHWGRWHDRFSCDPEGRWLFSSREVIVEGMADTSWLKAQA